MSHVLSEENGRGVKVGIFYESVPGMYMEKVTVSSRSKGRFLYVFPVKFIRAINPWTSVENGIRQKLEGLTKFTKVGGFLIFFFFTKIKPVYRKQIKRFGPMG